MNKTDKTTIGLIVSVGIFMSIVALIITSLSAKIDATARSNELLLYENAKLQSANAKLLEELEEGLPDLEDLPDLGGLK